MLDKLMQRTALRRIKVLLLYDDAFCSKGVQEFILSVLPPLVFEGLRVNEYEDQV